MTRISRITALTGYFGLFFLLIAWTAWLSPPQRLPIALVLLVLVGPLLLPLRGIIHGRPYTHAWVSFMALFYFAIGVFNVAGDIHRPWLGWLQIGFSLMLFCGTVLYVRFRAEEIKTALAKPSTGEDTTDKG